MVGGPGRLKWVVSKQMITDFTPDFQEIRLLLSCKPSPRHSQWELSGADGQSSFLNFCQDENDAALRAIKNECGCFFFYTWSTKASQTGNGLATLTYPMWLFARALLVTWSD